MKSFKLLAALIVAGLVLASCSLIPPVGIGADALGYDGEQIVVGTAAGAGMTTLSAIGGIAQVRFSDIERPDMPIAPKVFEAVQGFTATVTATHGTQVPASLTISSGSLELAVSDDETADLVSASAEFGTLTLNRTGSACTTSCEFTFADPAAAAASLTMSISGADLTELLSIITTGGDNTLNLDLDVVTQEDIASITFTIDVEENYIRF